MSDEHSVAIAELVSEISDILCEALSIDCHRGNLVEVVVDGLGAIANSITPECGRVSPTRCPTGEGYVSSLTEAVMGVAGGLVQIANAIGDLANAVREAKEND